MPTVTTGRWGTEVCGKPMRQRTVRNDDWVAGFTTLTAAPGPAPIDAAEGRGCVERLLRLAAALAGQCCPGGEACRPDCRLGQRPGGRDACRLLTVLAPAPQTPPLTDGAGLLEDYLTALREATTGVWYCRRVAHPAGHCWFSPAGPRAGVCGRVLMAAHGVAGPTASASSGG